MSRIADAVENQRELIEGAQSCLGNALVLIGLVQERLGVAINYGRQVNLLEPATKDLRQVEVLIRRAQRLAASTH